MNMNINMQCNIMRYFEKESAIVNALNSVCEDAPFSINIWTIRWAYENEPSFNIELFYYEKSLLKYKIYYSLALDPELILDDVFHRFEELVMKNIVFGAKTNGRVFDNVGLPICTFADIVDKLIMRQ